MLLELVSLTDFRNVESAAVGLGPAFTVVHGHNGAGKTNLLEALYLVSTLRSFRTSETRALVRRGRPGARVEVVAHDPTTDLDTTLAVRLDVGERSTRRTASCDGKTIRAAADFYGRFRAILFTPEDLGVLRGSPSGRRQFLDRVLFARERTHIADIQRYEKLLRSRNQVLKGDARGTADRARLLDTYDEELALVGARIWTRRVEVVEALTPGFQSAFARIHGPGMDCRMGYVSHQEGHVGNGASARVQALLDALREHRARDELRGTTGVGPHRDDLHVELDGAPAATFASQGQSRALVLAFKIAELASAREHLGTTPLLLLDDVSSELDPGRTAQLFDTLAAEAGQCVLTTTATRFISLPPGVDRVDVQVRDGRFESASDEKKSGQKHGD